MADSGLILTTSKELTFGRKDISTTSYSLHGTLDEVRIYSQALAPDEIATLKTLWNVITPSPVTGIDPSANERILYPNPAHGVFAIMGVDQPVTGVSLIDVTGRKTEVNCLYGASEGILQVECTAPAAGLMIIRVETTREVFYKRVVVY